MCFLLMNLLFELCYDFDDDDDDEEGSDTMTNDDKCDDIYMIYEHINLHGIDLLG